MKKVYVAIFLIMIKICASDEPVQLLPSDNVSLPEMHDSYSKHLIEYKPSSFDNRPCAMWATNCSTMWCSVYADELDGEEPTCPPPYCAKSCENSWLEYDCAEGEWRPYF